MIKAILFDFDGTLIDTNELIFESYRIAFRTVLNREIVAFSSFQLILSIATRNHITNQVSALTNILK